MSAHLCFILANVALALFGWAVARGMAGDERPCTRALVGIAAFALGIPALLLPAGSAGQLRPWPVAGGACLLAVTACLITRRCRASPREATGEDDAQFRGLGLALLAALGTVAALKVLTGGTQFFSDDFGYHGLAVNVWLREGRFDLIAPTFTAYYPLNSELFAAWFSLPYGHDAWAGLAGAFWLLLGAVGLGAAAEMMGLRPAAAALASALLLASQQVWSMVRTLAAADLALGVALFAAIIVTARAAHAKERPMAWAALAGALAGLALGMKVTVAPALVLLGAGLLFRKRGLPLALTFAGVAAVAGSFWFLRNWLLTGNPVFPGEAGPFAGPFTKAAQAEGKLITQILAHGGLLSFWPSVIRGYLDWPFGPAVFSLLGYGSALLAELRAGEEAPGARTLRRLLLSCGLLLLVTHPFLPFSWGSGFVNGELIPYARYVMPSFIFGIALSAPLFEAANPRAFYWRAAAVVAVVTSWPGPGGSVFVAVLAALLFPPVWRLAGPRVIGAGAGLVLLGAIPALTARQLAATDRNLAAFGAGEGKPLGAAWAALEKLPAGSRVTSFTHFGYHFSPLHGRRLQLVPVYTAPDGTLARPYHERFREDRAHGWHLPYTGTDGATLVANLQASGVQYLLLSRYPEDGWPPQYEPLRQSGRLAEVYRDDLSVIWSLPAP
ncbi:MAG: hypothetical protein QOE70_707 [Chthoniobacter sp.]|jgi:hypothetical protein|nr:hypothetical protein [Chthoniobacter sp.]